MTRWDKLYYATFVFVVVLTIVYAVVKFKYMI